MKTLRRWREGKARTLCAVFLEEAAMARRKTFTAPQPRGRSEYAGGRLRERRAA